jgi:large subunit ribosomal protein L1
MASHGKKYRAVKEKAPGSVVEIEEAIAFLKKNKTGKFDETMELGIRMGVDPKKSENAIRGTVSLPHGTGKNVRVVVFASGSAADAAREAGADEVGNEDLVEKVKGGWTDFDVAVATPEAMKEVRKLGRVLGPRGLMPNPKTGTVTDDTAEAVRQSKAGKVEFRMDRHGNINVPFGKLSFEGEKLAENALAVLGAIRAEKPSGAKGEYIKNCTVTSTMGVGVKVAVRE